MKTECGSILKRVAGVLLAVGLIDIVVMIYCLTNGISYSSSFNIFALIAGIFLLRGSLRAASIVRWLAVFMLAVLASLLVTWPFMQPLDLTLTQLRLDTGGAVATFALMAFVLGLLSWLVRQLGKEPIQIAHISAGGKKRDMRIPVGIGVAVVVAMGIFLALLHGSESAERAKAMAEQQVGPGYYFHLNSLTIVKNNQGTSVSGGVTAWTETQIQKVPVQWEER
jgi:hypothetical protein